MRLQTKGSQLPVILVEVSLQAHHETKSKPERVKRAPSLDGRLARAFLRHTEPPGPDISGVRLPGLAWAGALGGLRAVTLGCLLRLTQGTCQSCGVSGPNLWACLQVRAPGSGRGVQRRLPGAQLGPWAGTQGADGSGAAPKPEGPGQRVPGWLPWPLLKRTRGRSRSEKIPGSTARPHRRPDSTGPGCGPRCGRLALSPGTSRHSLSHVKWGPRHRRPSRFVGLG